MCISGFPHTAVVL